MELPFTFCRSQEKHFSSSFCGTHSWGTITLGKPWPKVHSSRRLKLIWAKLYNLLDALQELVASLNRCRIMKAVDLINLSICFVCELSCSYRWPIRALFYKSLHTCKAQPFDWFAKLQFRKVGAVAVCTSFFINVVSVLSKQINNENRQNSSWTFVRKI
jgi:hypothetical protein